jgi:hypothetical protein
MYANKRCRYSTRRNLCQEERLGRINIAYTSNNALVHQRCLDAATTTSQLRREHLIIEIWINWLWPKLANCSVMVQFRSQDKLHASKLSWVSIDQRPPILKLRNDMIVPALMQPMIDRLPCYLVINNSKHARHAKVHNPSLRTTHL